MVIVSMLPYAEFGRNDHREGVSHFNKVLQLGIRFLAPEEQNSTSLVLKECFDDNDGSQFFQTTKNGQIVHNIYKDYCLEANHPNIIMK